MNKIQEEIAYIMTRLYNKGLTTTSGGNISACMDEHIFITPSQRDKARLTASDIAEITCEGSPINKECSVSMETTMHCAIYKARPDVKAIVHAHPLYATTYTATHNNISIDLSGEALLLLAPIVRVPYACMGTQKLAQAVSEAAKKSDVLLLDNHGVVTLGTSLIEAFNRMEVCEMAARMTTLVKTIGSPSPLSKERSEQILALRSKGIKG